MKLKIPPALQVLLFALMMWGIHRQTQTKHLVFEYQEPVSWVIFWMGVVIGISAVYSFKKAQTTVDPLQPDKASRLVTSGMYRYSRNPMYLGMLLVLLALGIRMGNLYTLLVPPGYIWYITRFQIKPEEEVLEQLFRDEFLGYMSTVRRWI